MNRVPRLTRLWVLSDLHQEFAENGYDPLSNAPQEGFDVAVVAGDAHSPLARAMAWLGERMPGVPLVYVPGNHDFYWDGGEERYSLYDQMDKGRDLAARHGIHLLMDDSVVLDGTRFVGGTLWTDFRLGTFGWTHASRSASGRFGMNDYRYIRKGHNTKTRLKPEDVRDMHRATASFIRKELATPHDGANVVVTHHAPHPSSLRSPHDDLRWCYASDLTEMIHESAPEAWIHGHIHKHADYQVGETRIASNARGHRGEESAFKDAWTISVEPAPKASPAP